VELADGSAAQASVRISEASEAVLDDRDASARADPGHSLHSYSASGLCRLAHCGDQPDGGQVVEDLARAQVHATHAASAAMGRPAVEAAHGGQRRLRLELALRCDDVERIDPRALLGGHARDAEEEVLPHLPADEGSRLCVGHALQHDTHGGCLGAPSVAPPRSGWRLSVSPV
jgi:hypothetical protein